MMDARRLQGRARLDNMKAMRRLDANKMEQSKHRSTIELDFRMCYTDYVNNPALESRISGLVKGLLEEMDITSDNLKTKSSGERWDKYFNPMYDTLLRPAVSKSTTVNIPKPKLVEFWNIVAEELQKQLEVISDNAGPVKMGFGNPKSIIDSEL